MNFDALATTAPPQRQLPVCRFLRGLFYQVEMLLFVLVLLLTFSCLATYGPWLTNGMQKSTELEACSSYEDDCCASSPDIVIADSSLGYAAGNPSARVSIESVCANSRSSCFPPTLPGFSTGENRIGDGDLEVTRSQCARPLSVGSTGRSRWGSNESWSSDSGMLGILNGQTISCFLNFREGIDELLTLQIQKSKGLRLNENSEMKKSSYFDLSPSPHVESSPNVLDWGQKHLYFFSVAYLTVANSCNESILHVYEPFSTNIQFYPCNYGDLSLGPGERASICFVFLPRWLGLSLAHLILRTSTGGFLVQAKGYAVKSPYEISPLLSLGLPSGGRLSKNFSLFNPLNETMYMKEINMVSQENNSSHAEATRRSENVQDSELCDLLSVNNWLVVKSGQVGFPLMAIRPHVIWELSPHSSETILEIDFSFQSEGKIFGAFCMQLLRSSEVKSEKLIIPLEADPKGAYGGIIGPVSISLDALMTCNGNSTGIVAISVRNRSPQLLKVYEISEVAAIKIFQIKYVRGSILFPGSVTIVATVTCTQLHGKAFAPPEMLHVNKNCKLVVLTNDSSSPQTEIPCEEIIHACLRQQEDSAIGYDHHSEKAALGYRRNGSLDNSIQMPPFIKAFKTAEADEFVLGNWKSRGTANSMSMLINHKVFFPMVQVGSHCSKWISVKNPSQKPVVMQLILNSEAIIDECQGTDSFLESPSSISLAQAEPNASVKCGFLMAESALTEAYVVPCGTAFFGSIFFHPSNHCMWRNSALIRNNLSGVEWVSLPGFGGSLALIVLEGSETVQTVEFNLNSVVPPDISPPGILFHIREIYFACSQQFSKELYAKNIGDLPLAVTRIKVSGTDCGLDGFMVHTCKGFSLEPGESKMLLISFQAEHSGSMVQKDLKLALDGGILVIPMKANLPLYFLNFCRKSVLWIQVKKFSRAALLPATIIFFMVYCIFFQVVTLDSQGYSYRSAKNSLSSAKSVGKSSRNKRNQKNSKIPMLDQMDNLLRLPREDKSLKQTSTGRYCGSHDGGAEQDMISQNLTPTLGCYKQVDALLCNEKDKPDPSLSTKDLAIESSGILEASQSHNFAVRTGQEKGRKRRKRKGINAGLVGLFEVSSSQSGNSTPTSPLSPATSVTSNPTLLASPDIHPIQASSPFSQVADRPPGKFQTSEPFVKVCIEPRVSLSYTCFSSAQEQPSVPRKNSNKPVLLPSATFPIAGRTASTLLDSSSGPSASVIAPHTRAPGPSQKTMNLEGKVGDKYTYDIWGEHFSGLNLMGSPKNVTKMEMIATENKSNSFFVRGPQVLVTNSQPKYVSCFLQEG